MRERPYNRWQEPLPAWLGAMLRVACWGVALLVIYKLGLLVLGNRLAAHGTPECERLLNDSRPGSALPRTRRYLACLHDAADPLDRLTLKTIARYIEPMPVTPTAYVGTWVATRPGSQWAVALRADGTFDARQRSGPPVPFDRLSGAWSVIDDQFVWIYDEGVVWPPDINPLQPSATGFELIEKDGSRTAYRFESTATSIAP